MNSDCLFCKIVAGTIPAKRMYEDDLCLCFADIHPQAPTHVLVVPRRHIEDASVISPSDAEEVVALLTAAKAVADAEGIGDDDRGYRLVFNVGPDALNSVSHLHLHVLGGRRLDGPLG